MGIDCKITLLQSPERKYITGDYIYGNVNYEIDRERVFKEITVTLIGKGNCNWSEREDKGATQVTYYAEETLVSEQKHLLDCQWEPVNIKAGVYTKPFQFLLPSNIPPSYLDKYCGICYRIEVTFLRPGLFFSHKTFKKEFNVMSKINSELLERPLVYCIQKNLYKLFSNRKNFIRVKATMNKSMVRAGECVPVEFEVQNESDVRVLDIRVTLIELVTYTAPYGHRKYAHKVYDHRKANASCIEPGKIETVKALLHTGTTSYTIQNSQIIKRNYKLRASMKLPCGQLNKMMEMPLVIGEKNIELDDTSSEVDSEGSITYSDIYAHVPSDNESGAQSEIQSEVQPESEVQLESQSEIQTETQADVQSDYQPVRQLERQSEGQLEGESEGQTEGQSERQTGGQSGGQSEGQRLIETQNRIEPPPSYWEVMTGVLFKKLSR